MLFFISFFQTNASAQARLHARFGNSRCHAYGDPGPIPDHFRDFLEVPDTVLRVDNLTTGEQNVQLNWFTGDAILSNYRQFFVPGVSYGDELEIFVDTNEFENVFGIPTECVNFGSIHNFDNWLPILGTESVDNSQEGQKTCTYRVQVRPTGGPGSTLTTASIFIREILTPRDDYAFLFTNHESFENGNLLNYGDTRVDPTSTNTIGLGTFALSDLDIDTNELECLPNESFLEIYEQPDPPEDIFNNPIAGCEYNGVPEYLSIDILGDLTSTGIDISIPPDTFEFDGTYCARVSTRGIGREDSPSRYVYTNPFVFKTNSGPQLIRTGVKFGSEEPPVELNTNNIPANDNFACGGVEPSCYTPVDYNQVTSGQNLSGQSCWIGNSDTQINPTNNKMYLWVDYEDIDNIGTDPVTGQVLEEEINNILSNHSLVFASTLGGNPKTSINNLAPELIINSEIATLSENGFSIAGVDVKGNNSQFSSVRARKTLDGNRIRIFYEIQYMENFPSGKFSIYSSFTTPALSRTGLINGANLIPDEYTNDPTSFLPPNSRKEYLKLGEWGVDVEQPQPRVLNRFTRTKGNVFDIRYQIFENFDTGSGIEENQVSAFCNSNLNSTVLDLKGYYNSTQAQSNQISNTNTDPIFYNQGNSTDCFFGQPEIVTELATNGEVNARYSINPVENIDSFNITLQNLEDRACNLGTGNSTFDPSYQPPYIATNQGDVFIKNANQSTNLLPPVSVRSDFPITTVGFANTFSNLTGGNFPTVLPLNFFATFLSSTGSASSSFVSRIGMNKPGFTPQDFVDPRAEDRTDFFNQLLTDAIANRNDIVRINTPELVADGLSLHQSLRCQTDQNCIVYLIGNLNIPLDTACSANEEVLIYVDGDVNIRGNINKSGDSICTIINSGNITISPETQPKSLNNFALNLDYFLSDYINANLISNGNISILDESQIIGTDEYIADNLIIEGIVIADNISNERDLQLSNANQPPVLINYSPELIYSDFANELFRSGVIQIGEKR